jgi:hypothetical protein
MTSGIPCVFLRQGDWLIPVSLLGKYGCGIEYYIFDISSRRAAFCFLEKLKNPDKSAVFLAFLLS